MDWQQGTSGQWTRDVTNTLRLELHRTRVKEWYGLATWADRSGGISREIEVGPYKSIHKARASITQQADKVERTSN